MARIVPEVVEADAGRPDHGADVVGEGDGDRYRAFDAVRRWIDTIAARRRLVLVLDDMHWADRPSLLLLEYLLRATAAPAQVLVVVTYRPTEAHARSWFSEFLAGVRRNADVENIALSGLSPAETRELVEAALGRTLSADEAAGTVTLQRHTGGNPFFLREVVRDLARPAGPSRRGPRPTPTRCICPTGLRDVVHWRLRQLSGVCMGVLSAASAMGEEFDIATVRRAVDGDEETLLTALDEARQAGVVVESARPPATHRFTHAVVRQALYEDLGSARRARLHLRLATTLEARYGDDAVHHAGELARHFYLGAAAGGVDDALRYLRLAADDALQHVAYEAAVDHLTRALDIVTIHRPGDAVERCRLLLAIGAADVKAGRSAEADHRFLDAFAVADRCRWPDLLAEAALGYGGVLPAGSDPDPGARALLESALAALPDEDGRAQALVLGRLAQLGHFERPRAERVRLAGDAVAMARRLGQRSTLAAVLGYRYWALDGPDDSAGQIGVALEIRALGEEIGDREIVLHGLKCELHSRLEVGDFDASVRVATALGSLAAEVQQPEYLRLQCMWDSLVAGIEGRYADAEERAAEAIAILERTEHPQLYALYVGLSLPWRWLQGRMEELRPVLQLGVTGRTSPAETALVAWVASELGEVEQARALLDAMAPDDIADDDRNFHWWLLMVGLVRTSLNLVDRRWAAALYDIIEPYAEHNCRTGQATFLGAAAMHLGTLALVVGRDADAVRHLDAALARHRAMAARPLACVTARMLDAALRRRSGPGDVVRAEDLGRHASAEAAALGISLPAVPPAPVGGDSARVAVEVVDDVGEDVVGDVLADQRVEVAVAGEDAHRVVPRPVVLREPRHGAVRSLGTEDVVALARQEVDGDVAQQLGVLEVAVTAPRVHGPALLHHEPEVLETADAGHPEHLGQRLVGRLVELGVAVRHAEDGIDPAAHRLLAVLALGGGHGVQGELEHHVADGLVGVGVQELAVDGVDEAAHADVGLGHGRAAGHGMQRELGAHGGAHLAGHGVLPVEQGHEQRHRPHAVADHLHRRRARHSQDLVHGPGPVEEGDVVEGERGARRRARGAMVEEPHVVAGIEEQLDQIGVDRRREQCRGRDGEARCQQDRALVPASVAHQPAPRLAVSWQRLRQGCHRPDGPHSSDISS